MEWTFAPALEIGVDVGVIVVLVIFMLAQHEDLRNRMLRLSGTRNVTSTTKALGEASRRVRSYLTLQFFVNVLFGIVVAGGLWLIGVPYPWLWGVFGALLRYVPYIGTWLAAACPVLLSIALSDGWAQPLETVGLFVLLDLAITNSLEPIIYGRSIGVSGTALLIAAVFWTWMWGPVGLILSTPLTACVVVLGRTVPSLEFLSVVLGDQPPLSPHLTFYQRLLARDEDEASAVVEEYIQKNGVEKSYDHLLVPALAHAKWARDRGGMTSEDEEFILAATGRLLEDVVFPAQDVLDERETAKGGEEMKCRLLLLGCPAKDAMDELALRMLQRLLPAGKCQMEVLSKDVLAGEVLTRVGEVEAGGGGDRGGAGVLLFGDPLSLQTAAGALAGGADRGGLLGPAGGREADDGAAGDGRGRPGVGGAAADARPAAAVDPGGGAETGGPPGTAGGGACLRGRPGGRKRPTDLSRG